jgi:hypothetical protein
MERFKKVSPGLSPTIRIKGAPRIRIVRHLVGAGVSPFARTLGRPFRIVKLIGHAKTSAAHGRPTLLDGKEAAVGGSESPVDVKQRRCQHKRRNNFGHKAHLHLLAAIGKNTVWPAPFRPRKLDQSQESESASHDSWPTKLFGQANVRYWPKADIASCTAHVCFRG